MFRSHCGLLSCVVLGLALPGSAAQAELVEFELSGAVTFVAANGDPSFLEQLEDLGVVLDAPFDAILVYDTETPATSAGSYDRAVRFARIRIDGYELRGPIFSGEFSSATISVDSRVEAFSMFRVSSTQMEDAPDLLMPESTRSQVFEFSISGEPFFDSLELPRELPDPADGRQTAQGRFFGFDPIARRFGIGFVIDSIRRVGADGAPLHGGEPLLGLNLHPRAIEFTVASFGCTRKEDFRVDVEEAEELRLRLRRVTPDACEGPRTQQIVFRLRELGIRSGDRFRVVNPLAVAEAPSRRRKKKGR